MHGTMHERQHFKFYSLCYGEPVELASEQNQVSRYCYRGASKLGDAHHTFKQYNSKKCRHSSKVTIFYPGLRIENSIPFVNIVAPTILHIIMGQFISFTST